MKAESGPIKNLITKSTVPKLVKTGWESVKIEWLIVQYLNFTERTEAAQLGLKYWKNIENWNKLNKNWITEGFCIRTTERLKRTQ